MKRLKLNLDQLREELEILDLVYLKGIKGGMAKQGGMATTAIGLNMVVLLTIL